MGRSKKPATWRTTLIFLVPVIVIACLLLGEKLLPSPVSTETTHETSPPSREKRGDRATADGGFSDNDDIAPTVEEKKPRVPIGTHAVLEDSVVTRTPKAAAIVTTAVVANPKPKRKKLTLQQVHTVQCLVMSCYFRAPDFYRGRETPSYRWILVFIRSFFKVTKTESCGLLMFVDQESRTYLEDALSDEIHNRVRFMTIESNSTAQSMKFLKTERFATGLKNSANNFRFALIRDWLKIRVKAFKREEQGAAAARRWAKREAEGGGGAEEVTQALSPEEIALREIENFKKDPEIRDFKITPNTRILLSDVTDVAFQYSPFTDASCFHSAEHHKPKSPDVIGGGVKGGGGDRHEHHYHDVGTLLGSGQVRFTLENSDKTFKNEVYNRRWMNCIENGAATKRFAKSNAPVSCAGVTAGTAQGIATYATLQINMISIPESLQCSISEVKAALDQATHNYLLHSGMLKSEGVQVEASPHSWHCTFHGNFGKLKLASRDDVVTLLETRKNEQTEKGKDRGHGIPDEEALAAGQSKFVVNAKGVPYAVVHQYTSNRHPSVMKLMEQLYLSPGEQ